MTRDEERGTEGDGSRSETYCVYCYQQGQFLQNVTMEEMAEHNLQFLAEWNRQSGLNLDEAEARAGLLAFLPTLKRWRKERRSRRQSRNVSQSTKNGAAGWPPRDFWNNQVASSMMP